MSYNEIVMQADFEAAKTGSGTRGLSPQEALSLLEYCFQRGWFFQSVEAFEVKDEREILDLRYSLLGLCLEERSASNLGEHKIVAESKIKRSIATRNDFIFQIWIDKVD